MQVYVIILQIQINNTNGNFVLRDNIIAEKKRKNLFQCGACIQTLIILIRVLICLNMSEKLYKTKIPTKEWNFIMKKVKTTVLI